MKYSQVQEKDIHIIWLWYVSLGAYFEKIYLSQCLMLKNLLDNNINHILKSHVTV